MNIKVFEVRHCYLLLTVSLSEAINPPLDAKLLPKANDIAKQCVKSIPDSFPDVKDAAIDFRNAVHGILNNIVLEYSAMFAGEDEQSG